MTHVLTIKMEGNNHTEIHLLNPGEHFPNFGGSRAGLTTGKTASLILHRVGGGSVSDTEYDIYDKGVWNWLAGLINKKAAVEAIGPTA